MEKRFCVDQPVLEIEGVKIGVPRRHVVLSDKGRKKRKFASQIDDFNAPPPDLIFLNENALSGTVRKVLDILEDRARQFNGDTKMFNSRIAAILKVSEKTVQRAIKELRTKGFLAIHMERTSRNPARQVRTIRVIRCWRVFAVCGMYPYKNVPWESDIRPEFDQKKIRQRAPHLLWQPPVFKTIQGTDREGNVVKKKQRAPLIEQSEGYLFRLGLFPEMVERINTMEDRRNAFDGEAIDICGYNGLQRFISRQNKKWKEHLAERGMTADRARYIRKMRGMLREEIARATERVRVLDIRQGMAQYSAHEAFKNNDFVKYADSRIQNDKLDVEIRKLRTDLSEMIEREKQLREERYGIVPSLEA